MSDLIQHRTVLLPSQIIQNAGSKAEERFIEFFVAQIRNPNTRLAYYRSVLELMNWAESVGIEDVRLIQPVHVATWVEDISKRYSVSSVKQKLAAVKMLFDWLVTGQIIPTNPANSVKSPRQSIQKGKTPVLDPSEARKLLSSINTQSLVGLRDRAIIGTMLYTFARIGAVLSMKVEDVFIQNRRLWVRLHEKGGKLHDMPCHHELEVWLDEYLEKTRLRKDSDGWLFRCWDRKTGCFGNEKLPQANAYAMVKRRARKARIKTRITNHTFRATGITAYLLNNGTLEAAAKMANHASTRTTQLYDRRNDQVTISEVERIRFE
ncbi:MAG: tyrosine-type recombinase/integrase [Mesorhizobium sp.]